MCSIKWGWGCIILMMCSKAFTYKSSLVWHQQSSFMSISGPEMQGSNDISFVKSCDCIDWVSMLVK